MTLTKELMIRCKVRNAEWETEDMSRGRKRVMEMSLGVEQASEKCHLWCWWK